MSRLQFDKKKPPSKLIHPASAAFHAQVSQYEDDNTAVEAANKTSAAAETTVSVVSHERQTSKQRQSRAAHIGEEARHEAKNRQHENIKRQYAEKKRNAEKTGEDIRDLTEKAAEAVRKTKTYIAEHKKGFLIAIAVILVLALMVNVFSSCALLGQTVSTGIAASTYPSQDLDMYAAEAEYSALETQLQRKLDRYEREHDYDEYVYDLDSIGHDPYVLISAITAIYGGEWTISQVHGIISMLFGCQYTLTEYVETETIEPEEDEEAEEPVEPTEYTTCYLTLENEDLSHIPAEVMDNETLGWYAVYMATLGNRPDLFPGSSYVGRYGRGSYLVYDIPPEALEDEAFAAIIKEAEKYLGYPYVWGGSTPSTSFDCSGFVCWVLNNCGVGWSVGRTTAQGLCNICTPVSAANARPGDLAFFMGTYDTPEVSHVAIYVGNGMMLHAGDPISYTTINTDYWQAHLYTYGRLPEP